MSQKLFSSHHESDLVQVPWSHHRSKLSWNSHIDAVTKRANQTTASLHRNLSSCPKDVKDICYKSIVHPQLAYASPVWDPETIFQYCHIVSLYRGGAFRFCCNNYPQTSSVTSMLQQLGWEDLQSRQDQFQNKATKRYRIVTIVNSHRLSICL